MSRVIAAFAQFFDGTGAPLANGWLRFLETGTTTTFKTTYVDADQSIPNENPVQLDAEGRCPNVFGQGIYRVVLYENDTVTNTPGAQIASFDPVRAEYITSGAGDNFSEWDASTVYQVSSIVTYGGWYYRSHIASNVGLAPDSNPAAWERIDFLRFWNINVTYNTDEVVIYGSNIYFSLVDSNLGNQPDISPASWDSVASGTLLLNWQEVGTIFRPGASGYDLGDTSHLIGDAYFQNGSHVYIGNSQNFDITHTGAVAQVINNTGDLYITNVAANFIRFSTTNTSRWDVKSDGHFAPFTTDVLDVGTTSQRVRSAYLNDSLYLGAAQEGRFHISASDLFISVVGFNDIVFRANTSTELWRISGTNGAFYPITTDTYDIGGTANRVKNVYLGDNCYLYLGDSQDFQIFFSGSNASITTAVGNVYLVSTVGELCFRTSTVDKWRINQSGNLFPVAADTYNLGEASNEVKYVYCRTVYMGTGQGAYIFHNGTNSAYYAATGFINIMTISGNVSNVNLGTNGTNRWSIHGNTGNFYPTAANTYDIGTVAAEVKSIYAISAYFGTSQKLLVTNDNVNSNIASSGDPLKIQTTGSNDIVLYSNSAEKLRVDDSVPAITLAAGVKLDVIHTYSNPESGRSVIVDSNGNYGTAEASLRSLKRNITPVKDASWIYDLEVVSYEFKKDNNEGLEIGVIAEDLEAINPDMCFYDYEWGVLEDGGLGDDKKKKRIKKEETKKLYGVKYRNLYMAMLKEMQSLKEEIDNLKKIKEPA